MIWSREIDFGDPAEAAARLRHLRGLAFLDSSKASQSASGTALGRYSYIGVEPFGVFTSSNGISMWNGMPTATPPVTHLRQLMGEYLVNRHPGLPPLQTGAIGFLSYEFGWPLMGSKPPYDSGAQPALDAHLGFFDTILAFDHVDRRAFIIASGLPQIDPQRRAARALMRIETMQHWLARTKKPEPVSHSAQLEWFSNFDAGSYCLAVERVREHILAGDVYQTNISQQFIATLPPDFSDWGFYKALRISNPASFAAYLQCGAIALASSSPERLVRLSDRAVEARPIKGTIRRSPDPREDEELAAQLEASAKDRAENIMIVDLLRNDISRVCKPHSVQVPVLCGLESYASVHHLVSVVTGELDTGRDSLDLIAATFPGGSITGAPKLRAMQIIAEIEGVARGPYCGMIGWFGFDGSLDANIAIRTVILANNTATFNVGGGITCLSDGAAEYDETLAKARRIFDAFTTSSLRATS